MNVQWSHLVIAAVALSACSDVVAPPKHPSLDVATLAQQGALVPRESEPHTSPRWATRPDSELWAAGLQANQEFIVGLKAPQALRGVYRGTAILDRASWSQGIAAVAGANGITLLRADSVHLPILKVRMQSQAVLALVRHLPFIDYVEPNARLQTMDSGCGVDTYAPRSAGVVPLQ